MDVLILSGGLGTRFQKVMRDRPKTMAPVNGRPILDVLIEKFLGEIRKNSLESRINLVGDISQSDLPQFYNKARVFINLSLTGSLDKAVLEAMSVNLPVYTSNEAFLEGNYPVQQSFDKALSSDLDTRNFVVKNHSLSNLIHFLINKIQ